ncbi:MAG: hypothetical protein QOD63_1186, partial [Actinomycetota bacterium]|nr:hypothetical protein [Actinomycetota bacterium]
MNARNDSRLAGPGLIGRLGRRRDERGAMLVLSAVGLVVALIFTALAVDIGFLAADKRTDQKIADLAALDASRDLAGVAANCSAPPSGSGPLCPAVVSATRNFRATDAATTISAQLVSRDGAGDYIADSVGKYVRVTVASPRKPFFPFVSSNTRTVKAVAVAGNLPEAEISVGSTLASVDVQKSFLDPILGPMLGLSTLNMNAVSYGGLVGGNVDLKALQTNLLAMGYDVGTTDKLLNTSIKASDLLSATA